MSRELEQKDAEKTREQLLQEIVALRQRIATLEANVSEEADGSEQNVLEQSHPENHFEQTDRLHRSQTHRSQIERQRLELVLQTSDIGIWFCNLPSLKLEWDVKCKQHFGLPARATVTIKHFLKQLHPDDRRGIRRAVQRAIRDHSVYDVTCRLITPKGQPRWIRTVGSVFYNASGQASHFDGISIDVTEQKRQEEERDSLLYREQLARETAEAANRVKDEFLGVLSHELRSPLNPILGWSRLLQKRSFDPTTTQRALQTIERNAKLQTQLIEDLLDISRILRGKLALNTCTVDLADVITDTLKTLHLATESKSIKIHTHFDPSVGAVAGDPVRLQQIIWNLLSNAIKFTPAEGWVEVKLEKTKSENIKSAEARRDEIRVQDSTVLGRTAEKKHLSFLPTPLFPMPADCAQITVTDTGRGINPDFLPCVFDYFRQANSSTTRKFGGLGLGLAIARHLVELHGGTIHVTSPGEGQGATFTIFLPMLKQPNETPQPEDISQLENPLQLENIGNQTDSILPAVQHPTQTSLAPLEDIRILIVDHQTDTREIATVVLKQFGAETIVSRSTHEALRTVIRERPDVILIDLETPDANGYRLMEQIRTLPSHQGGQTPAIALTSYAGEYNQQKAIEAGFQFHLSKAVEAEALVAAVSRLVRNPS